MASVCFYFQVHQPRRIKKYRIYDIGKNSSYFDDKSESNLNNRKIIKKVSEKCYLPTNKLILKLLKKYPKFCVSYSLSGVFLEQLEEYSKPTLKSFQKLVDTGRVELLSETYYHSLSFLYSRSEFVSQIELHKKKIKELFGVTPTVFRNTELIYNDDLGRFIEKIGYKGIITEGADHVLDWRSPNFVYKAAGSKDLKVLLKNYKLSDDIAFRFSSRSWSEWPLTSEKFAQWVSSINGNGQVVNLFMDYETFGEHQWEDTGIFKFLENLPSEILKHPDNDFVTPTDAIKRYKPIGDLSCPNFISWADVERDLSAWMSNDIQKDALRRVYELEKKVFLTNNAKLIEDWRRLTTSDHFYYMCTKWFNDGDVHKYFNPYDSPYDAFIYFMRVLTDLETRIERKLQIYA
ncbi:MAG: glycoside hydrolase family 57 protein [Candidatus Woesebacteria bacterium]|nr:MAG: glycoside hydrolase family 57 protein [Candidatus Woesebacteria bacterium]